MPLSFPTRPHGQADPGMPVRASHCRCARPLHDERTERCVWCGRHPKELIHETFRERAIAIANKRKKKP